MADCALEECVASGKGVGAVESRKYLTIVITVAEPIFPHLIFEQGVIGSRFGIQKNRHDRNFTFLSSASKVFVGAQHWIADILLVKILSSTDFVEIFGEVEKWEHSAQPLLGRREVLAHCRTQS